MLRRFQFLIFIVIAVAIAIVGAFSIYALTDYSDEMNEQRLHSVDALFVHLVKEGATYDEAYELCQDIFGHADAGIRVTVIAEDGEVLFDSTGDLEMMDNHADRSEIAQAISTGKTVSEKRMSETVGLQMLYLARFHPETQTVTRVSAPMLEYRETMAQMRYTLIFVMLISFFLISALGAYYSKKWTGPLVALKEATQGYKSSDFSFRFTRVGKDEAGELARAFNAMADELEQKVNDLEIKNEKLAKLEQMRSEFVANVSHELRTPLTSIRGFIDTLRSADIDDPQVRERFLDIIDVEAHRLHQLINDILYLSEMDSIKTIEDDEHFDLVDVVKEVVLMLEDKAQARQIDVEIINDSDMPVRAGRFRIKQVIINLLDNAIKYNHPGGHVWIRLSREPNRMVAISVSDDGEGIPPEHHDRLFERFYRVDKSRSKEEGGTGLGLSIVKHIAQLYDGTASIDTKKEKGACFIVRLRIADDLI